MRFLTIHADVVTFSFIEALLKDAAVPFTVFDAHMADLLAGQNSLFPRRLGIPEDHYRQALRVLHNAGLGDNLSEEPLS